MERTCKKCGETKPIEEFIKYKRAADGLGYSNLCKLCNRNRYLQNIERELQTCKKYRQSHRDKIREKNYKYKKEHKEWYKLICEKYRSENKTQINLSQCKYRSQHPERIAYSNKKRVEELTDYYISSFYRMKVTELRQHPELIELKRAQLQLLRLTKKEKV